jgi:MFS family permease
VVAAAWFAAPCVWAVASARTLPGTITAAACFGICVGMYLANLFATAFEVVPRERRGSAAGFLNLVGAFFSGFAGLFGGLLKKTLGLDGLMAASAVACLGAGLLLACAIRLAFDRDYQRSRS